MESIFVSVASYRDPICPKTLQSLFNQAEYPSRIYIGLVQQNKEGSDNDCTKLDDINNSWMISKNVRSIQLDYLKAKGPCYARYLASTLWQGENYYFQIDSHTKVVKKWDTKLINMIKSIQSQGLSQKPALTHYPDNIDAASDESTTTRPQICSVFKNDRGMLSYNGAESRSNISNDHFVKTRHFAAGFFFAPSAFLKDVPFDPNLDYLFVGEEILHAARLFTSGWDLFVPSESIGFHFYTREGQPKFWTDIIYSDNEAFEKVKQILHLNRYDDNVDEIIDYTYGLGKIRTLSQFYDEIGFDRESGLIIKNDCKEGGFDVDIINKLYYSRLFNKLKKLFYILIMILLITWFMVS